MKNLCINKGVQDIGGSRIKSMTEIKCMKDGPLFVSGEFKLTDSNGKAVELGGRKQVGLCRCGHSNDQPFCDGRHRVAGFASAV